MYAHMKEIFEECNGSEPFVQMQSPIVSFPIKPVQQRMTPLTVLSNASDSMI